MPLTICEIVVWLKPISYAEIFWDNRIRVANTKIVNRCGSERLRNRLISLSGLSLGWIDLASSKIRPLNEVFRRSVHAFTKIVAQCSTLFFAILWAESIILIRSGMRLCTLITVSISDSFWLMNFNDFVERVTNRLRAYLHSQQQMTPDLLRLNQR